MKFNFKEFLFGCIAWSMFALCIFSTFGLVNFELTVSSE